MKDNIDSVMRYHERTKHYPNRYARAPGFLDWANEPDPFRRYEGSGLVSLPLSQRDPDAGYHGLYERGRNIFQPFSLENLSAFLELSLGLSAWKSYSGNSWTLRINLSSGNLHPTEAYLILQPLAGKGTPGGVYHYNSFFHGLEQRASFATDKPRIPGQQHLIGEYEFFQEEISPQRAAAVIRRRRSALAFDGKTVLPKKGLFGMLDKTIPRGGCTPFDMDLGEPSVHLLIFLHRASELEPGLYFLVRNLRDLEDLRSRCRPDFLWERIVGTSEPVHLYLLRKGGFRNEGATAG
jgi:hypothetical protein